MLKKFSYNFVSLVHSYSIDFWKGYRLNVRTSERTDGRTVGTLQHYNLEKHGTSQVPASFFLKEQIFRSLKVASLICYLRTTMAWEQLVFFFRVAAIIFFDFQAGITLSNETGTGTRCFLCTMDVVSIVERQIC